MVAWLLILDSPPDALGTLPGALRSHFTTILPHGSFLCHWGGWISVRLSRTLREIGKQSESEILELNQRSSLILSARPGPLRNFFACSVLRITVTNIMREYDIDSCPIGIRRNAERGRIFSCFSGFTQANSVTAQKLGMPLSNPA